MSESPHIPPSEQQELWNSIRRFLAWRARNGGASYDPYDIWGTRYGLFSRRLYYARPPLGAPLVAPILLLEILAPGFRSLWVEKQHFATADGQLLLALLNLQALEPQAAHAQQAEQLGRELLDSSIPGFSGHCWGYPFDWLNNRGLWKKNTPYITATPYCFEAFLGLFDLTGDPRHLEIAASAARFVFSDLKDTPTSGNASAGSYSPADTTRVVNASAYRAFVLFEAARRFSLPAYRERAWMNLNFILQSQRPDGAWLYAVDHPGGAFIDHFHTCFVLKNLCKINRHLRNGAVREALHRGYAFYRRALFDAAGNPRQYAVRPRTQIVRLEMYDFAEAITLGALLRDEIPDAFTLARQLAGGVLRRHQLPDGHFVTRVYLGGWKHTLPFLRWPQAQMFYALTNLLRALSHA